MGKLVKLSASLFLVIMIFSCSLEQKSSEQSQEQKEVNESRNDNNEIDIIDIIYIFNSYYALSSNNILTYSEDGDLNNAGIVDSGVLSILKISL